MPKLLQTRKSEPQGEEGFADEKPGEASIETKKEKTDAKEKKKSIKKSPQTQVKYLGKGSVLISDPTSTQA